MEYVYFVYDEWYDVCAVYDNAEGASNAVKEIRCRRGRSGDEPDFDNIDAWGWEEDVWWARHKVRH